MRRPAVSLAILALPVVLWGCGSDAKDEAPAAATGDALAQAPPNAVGANVPAPVATPPPKTTAKDGVAVPPMKAKPKYAPGPEDSGDPLADPAPPGAENPKKGTDL